MGKIERQGHTCVFISYNLTTRKEWTLITFFMFPNCPCFVARMIALVLGMSRCH
jgi:hypothetical protein